MWVVPFVKDGETKALKVLSRQENASSDIPLMTWIPQKPGLPREHRAIL